MTADTFHHICPFLPWSQGLVSGRASAPPMMCWHIRKCPTSSSSWLLLQIIKLNRNLRTAVCCLWHSLIWKVNFLWRQTLLRNWLPLSFVCWQLSQISNTPWIVIFLQSYIHTKRIPEPQFSETPETGMLWLLVTDCNKLCHNLSFLSFFATGSQYCFDQKSNMSDGMFEIMFV